MLLLPPCSLLKKGQRTFPLCPIKLEPNHSWSTNHALPWFGSPILYCVEYFIPSASSSLPPSCYPFLIKCKQYTILLNKRMNGVRMKLKLMAFQICTCIHSRSFFGKQAPKVWQIRYGYLSSYYMHVTPLVDLVLVQILTDRSVAGLRVCISNKLQVITMLLIPLRDKITANILLATV